LPQTNESATVAENFSFHELNKALANSKNGQGTLARKDEGEREWEEDIELGRGEGKRKKRNKDM